MGSKNRGRKRKRKPLSLLSHVEFRKYEAYWNMREESFKNGFNSKKPARKTAYRVSSKRAAKRAHTEWENRSLFVSQMK